MKPLHHPQVSSLFIAILSKRKIFTDYAIEKFSERFGIVHSVLDAGKFDHSEYYQQEMGMDLERVFCSFKPPFKEDQIIDAKLYARTLEWNHAIFSDSGVKRSLNIDPGFVSLSRVVLSTSKNYSHRLLLGEGVYGEVTLIYRQDGWQLLPWTYPDYKNSEVQSFLLNVRQSLHHYISSNSLDA